MESLLDITTLIGFSIRLLIAIVLGFFVGLERQWTRHQAGIMTNVIVCVGAYAYTAFSYLLNDGIVDKTRIAAQVVCGIGFLGAGLILRDGTNVRGLSTAATIWTTAAVGILCTLADIFYAIIVAVAIVILHLLLHPVAAYINRLSKRGGHDERGECFYKISITCYESNEVDLRAHLMRTLKDEKDLLLHNLESTDTDDGNIKIRAYVSASRKKNEAVENVLNRIGKDEGIIKAGWNITE